MVKDKIKALLSIKGKSQIELSEAFNVSKQSINRKISNSETAFNTADLIKLSDLTNTTLAFVDNETGKTLIEFDSSDIENKE